MQIGRPLMSDSTATDNFARPIIRERTEFGSDPDFSPTSISKTYIGVEKINSTSRENSQSRQCHSELYLLQRSIISISAVHFQIRPIEKDLLIYIFDVAKSVADQYQQICWLLTFCAKKNRLLPHASLVTNQTIKLLYTAHSARDSRKIDRIGLEIKFRLRRMYEIIIGKICDEPLRIINAVRVMFVLSET